MVTGLGGSRTARVLTAQTSPGGSPAHYLREQPTRDETLLQVSDNAVNALEEARRGQGVPSDHGVRIGTQPDESGQVSVTLGFVEAPAEGDQVTEAAGTEVYVAQELAEPLAQSLVDVEDTDQGAQLVIKPQPTETPEA